MRKLAPRSLYALNRQAIMDRIDAGYLASDVFRELTDFLASSKLEAPTHASSFYEFLKLEKDKAEKTKSGGSPARSETQPSPKQTAFDPEKKYDESDLV